MRPIIIHHHNCLSIGGTERMCQIMMKYFVKEGTYNHVLAYKAQEDRSREQYFREIMGSNKLIAYASYPEFITIVRRLRPFIIHRYSAGIQNSHLFNQLRTIQSTLLVLLYLGIKMTLSISVE